MARSCIGRLNPDGTVDAGFDPGASGRDTVAEDTTVFSLVVQADGKIVAGGELTALGGGGTGIFPRSQIGRLNPDGTLDTSFDPGANNDVKALAVQPDGKILVVGDFTKLDGGGTGVTTRNLIGRLNVDGSLDMSFCRPGANNPAVIVVAVQADRKVLVGGTFTMLGGGGSGIVPRRLSDAFMRTVRLITTLTPGRIAVCVLWPCRQTATLDRWRFHHPRGRWHWHNGAQQTWTAQRQRHPRHQL